MTARYTYDPFGKRRFTQGTYDAAGTLVIDWSNAVNNGTDRGFTGHEHLDDLGLIHMNGRIYDPTLGRFLSADPHVAAAFDLQNYDRYAYVLNNPLASTDPTGFDSDREPWLNDHGFDRALDRVVVLGSPFGGGGGCAAGNATCIEHIMQTLQNQPVNRATFLILAVPASTNSVGRVAIVAAVVAAACNAHAPCKAKMTQAAEQLSKSFNNLLTADNGKAEAEAEASGGLKTDGASTGDPGAEPPPDGNEKKSRAQKRQEKIDSILQDKKLPTEGEVKFEPPKKWNPSEPLPRGDQNGFMDRFGREWVKGMPLYTSPGSVNLP